MPVYFPVLYPAVCWWCLFLHEDIFIKLFLPKRIVFLRKYLVYVPWLCGNTPTIIGHDGSWWCMYTCLSPSSEGESGHLCGISVFCTLGRISGSEGFFLRFSLFELQPVVGRWGSLYSFTLQFFTFVDGTFVNYFWVFFCLAFALNNFTLEMTIKCTSDKREFSCEFCWVKLVSLVVLSRFSIFVLMFCQD